MTHFEVGHKVICIKDHSRRIVKRGQVFELQSIRKFECGCTALNVGIPSTQTHRRCLRHNLTCYSPDKTYWLSAALFAPADDTLSTLTADELIEQLELQII